MHESSFFISKPDGQPVPNIEREETLGWPLRWLEMNKKEDNSCMVPAQRLHVSFLFYVFILRMPDKTKIIKER
jgi:hypothetical protein